MKESERGNPTFIEVLTTHRYATYDKRSQGDIPSYQGITSRNVRMRQRVVERLNVVLIAVLYFSIIKELPLFL